jgi:hypothetical protein
MTQSGHEAVLGSVLDIFAHHASQRLMARSVGNAGSSPDRLRRMSVCTRTFRLSNLVAILGGRGNGHAPAEGYKARDIA